MSTKIRGAHVIKVEGAFCAACDPEHIAAEDQLLVLKNDTLVPVPLCSGCLKYRKAIAKILVNENGAEQVYVPTDLSSTRT